MRAWALSIDNETPRCSDQPKESRAVHAKVAVAIAIFPKLKCFMTFLQYYCPLLKTVRLGRWQSLAPEVRVFEAMAGCLGVVVAAFSTSSGSGLQR
jgi:hypothetical protein